MHASRSPTHLRSLDGIAVISDIVSSAEPERAARDLAGMMRKCKEEIKECEGRFGVFKQPDAAPRKTRDEWVEGVAGLMRVVKEHKPLAHQVSVGCTLVVPLPVAGADYARVVFSFLDDQHRCRKRLGECDARTRRIPDHGHSPTGCQGSKQDPGRLIDQLRVGPLFLVKFQAGLSMLINARYRTISDKQGMIVAGQEANKNRKPVIFDPVAVGATSYRRETAKGEFADDSFACVWFGGKRVSG